MRVMTRRNTKNRSLRSSQDGRRERQAKDRTSKGEDEDEILGSNYARNVGGTILEHVNKGRKRGNWRNE